MHVPLRAHFPAQSVWASVRTDRCVRVRNRGWRSRCAQVGSAPPERRSLRRIRSEPGKAPGCVFGRGGPRRAGFGSACPLSAPTGPPPLTDARETLCENFSRRHCDGRLPPGHAPPRSGHQSTGSPCRTCSIVPAKKSASIFFALGTAKLLALRRALADGASYPSAVKTALEIHQKYDLLWIVRACARSFLTRMLRREFERAQEAQSARA